MNSIRTRVLLALLIAGLIPVILMLVTTHTLSRRAILVSERDKLSELGDEVRRQVLRILDDATDDLSSMAKSSLLMKPDFSEVAIEAKRKEFRRLTSSYANLREISLLDAQGYYIASDSEDASGKLDETQEIRTALASRHGTPIYSKPLWVTPFTAFDGTKVSESYMHMTVHMPIAENEGDPPHSVVRASVNFDSFWEVLDQAKVGETGGFALLDSSGNLLNHLDRDRILTKFDRKIPPEFWAEHRSGEFWNSDEEKDYIYEVKPLPKSVTGIPEDWFLVCYQSTSEVSALVDQSQRHLLIAGLVTLLVASGVGFALAGKISRSVKQASIAAQEVAKGDMEITIPESGYKEMRGLAVSFNQMVVELKDHRDHLEALVQSRTRRLRESQADLEDLTAQLRAAYESTREAIIVVRPNGEVLAANRRIEQFFDLNGARLLEEGLGEGSESRGDLLSCFEDSPSFESVWKRHAASADLIHEEEWVVSGATRKELSVYTAPVKNSHGKTFARLWMFRDMTEQRHLERGLQQAQKMEAIGRLSGGVAHDFNNLLTGIIGNLSLSELQGELPKESEHLVLSAKRAAERAAGIVKQLLTFSRQSKMSLRPWSANQLVKEVEEILIPGLDPSITLSVDLDPSTPYMLADGNQIDQVLMNFCVNARDALPNGGRITVSTSKVVVDRSSMPKEVDCEPGDYVRVSVEDTGTGMEQAVLEKVFEPFFTTKEQGKGTGLGLATSYGIVQEHSGWIECKSELGEGTRFTAYIPACDTPAECELEKKPSIIRGGNETILVVDDEPIVRRVAEGVLRRQGYEVMTAQDGREALEVVAQHGTAINLIMLDLTMPRLSGRETFRELRNGSFPHIPVVICSGYLVELDSFAEEEGSAPEGVVQKPYQVENLASELRRVLDSTAANRT